MRIYSTIFGQFTKIKCEFVLKAAAVRTKVIPCFNLQKNLNNESNHKFYKYNYIYVKIQLWMCINSRSYIYTQMVPRVLIIMRA